MLCRGGLTQRSRTLFGTSTCSASFHCWHSRWRAQSASCAQRNFTQTFLLITAYRDVCRPCLQHWVDAFCNHGDRQRQGDTTRVPPRLLELARRSLRVVSGSDTQLAGDQPLRNLSMSNSCENSLLSCDSSCRNTHNSLGSCLFFCVYLFFICSHLYLCPSGPCQRCLDKEMPCVNACRTSCGSHSCTSTHFVDECGFRQPDTFWFVENILSTSVYMELANVEVEHVLGASLFFGLKAAGTGSTKVESVALGSLFG